MPARLPLPVVSAVSSVVAMRQHKSDQDRRKCDKPALASLAKRQIDALAAKQRVLAIGKRRDAVKNEARWPAPDHDIAMLQAVAHRLVRALQAAPEEGRR